MPRIRLGLKVLQIAACAAITAGLSPGCELVVGELPQTVDSVSGGKHLEDAGAGKNGAGGRSTGGSGTQGGAFGHTSGGSSGLTGGAPNEAGGVENGGSPNGDSGGGASGSGNGGAMGNGGQISGGGVQGGGGQTATGGSQGMGGSLSTGGAQNTGGASGCKKPPCDCDGDGGLAEGPCGGDDCDDADPLVYKGEPTYYPNASLHNGYDYDCSGTFDVNPVVNVARDCNLVTNLLQCDTTTQGFLSGSVPACGASGDWGHCDKGLVCSNHSLGTRQVTCK